MSNRFRVATAAFAALALALTACGGDGDEGNETPNTEDTNTADTGDESTGGGGEAAGSMTMAGWSLSTTPEFQLLADGFNETNPEYTIELVEYDPNEYETQISADLAAGAAPDVYPVKQLSYFPVFASGGQLMEVQDVADGLGDNESVQFYEYEGAAHAVPYRQDAWFLYYNKDMFEAAGVEEPDGTWTWDDYVTAAKELTENLEGGAKGAYQHSWQSTLQGFANAQVADGDMLSGEFDFYLPYYERALDLQSAGAQETFGTVTTNQLTYQSQFGTQRTAMMLMGSWYIATLLAHQESGEAEDFEWGIAPAPQVDDSTVGPDNTPITFGAPTGMGINPGIDEAKVQTAKDFLTYVASEEGALALVDIGITPAVITDPVIEAFFAGEGMPQDELSKWTFSTREVGLEYPVSDDTSALNNILNDAHSAILSESEDPQAALDAAEQRAANEVLNR